MVFSNKVLEAVNKAIEGDYDLCVFVIPGKTIMGNRSHLNDDEIEQGIHLVTIEISRIKSMLYDQKKLTANDPETWEVYDQVAMKIKEAKNKKLDILLRMVY